MSENYSEILYNVLEESLESLAFMFAESIDTSDIAMTDTECIKVTMEFTGDLYNGSLMMIVPSNISSEIAANILGIEDTSDDATDLGDDSLKEVLNVICGRVLTEISGTEPLFDLSIPEIEKISCTGLENYISEQNTCSAIIDDMYPIILQFKKY
ncbi:MAG: chemotaxis protein CheX [Candidatus Marinimicrobia bacterium]|nr:chemotaxis protein CheX [Candidatus Neomarinimicrobiota bacterium]